MTSRPDISKPSRLKRGADRPMIHDSENRSRMRDNTAIPRPMTRAFCCWAAGSLLARIEIKITLSTPKTSSRATRVKKAIHACGSVSQSILIPSPSVG